ncbi:type II secretion system F family protein [Helcococcus kunzii]|uniref:Type II secretion system protein GspF domain-containing protein n=1 Tax=Helcococcus kunzii ATCC 51366 TaxID=883114 RepID=H3NPV9_9FIRM|nr:hypothetical protein [Helcococcus kunzii]EHR33337.1 hypothetical protein HMPREF9709_01381 [Helcococcus kunzii ATCC 51366]MCT1795993.1 hypothetical protein [Helcococcus kunzii]MCT1988231.1 hypothetical protein [Helcococcus kunzii]QUY65275.1 hypothetical protein GUI37_06960 [Helcococcus kunzii]QZO75930.1 hypothetical protein HIF96_06490 [Helcococcus kunzii]
MIFKKNSKKKSKKNSKKESQKQYLPSLLNTKAYNYKVYKFSLLEKILYTVFAFLAGAIVAYIFYGGIGKDSFGNVTNTTKMLNTIFMIAGGILAVVLFLPARNKAIQEKNQIAIRNQFRDMLEALYTSLGSGKNVRNSFESAREDLKLQYDEESFIIKELNIIISGIQNNIDIEELLLDFGNRTGIDDIKTFSEIFKVTYRKGGNIKETIGNTKEIITEKMNIMEEIETMVTKNKTDQNIMVFMPVMMIGFIKFASSDFAENFTSPIGIFATTLGIVAFVSAYFIGKKILSIKI